MITMSGISSGEPVCGNHECCAERVDASDCSMPMTIPAAAVGNISSKWPTAAAASVEPRPACTPMA